MACCNAKSAMRAKLEGLATSVSPVSRAPTRRLLGAEPRVVLTAFRSGRPVHVVPCAEPAHGRLARRTLLSTSMFHRSSVVKEPDSLVHDNDEAQLDGSMWEVKCSRCHGAGTVRSAGTARGGRRDRRGLRSCALCSGLGYVRQARPVDTGIEPDSPATKDAVLAKEEEELGVAAGSKKSSLAKGITAAHLMTRLHNMGKREPAL